MDAASDARHDSRQEAAREAVKEEVATTPRSGMAAMEVDAESTAAELAAQECTGASKGYQVDINKGTAWLSKQKLDKLATIFV